MKRWLSGCCCVLMCGVALAAPGTTNQQVVESSMLLTGTVAIAPDGSVRSHAVDHPEKLSPTIRAFVDKTVSAWKFVPVVVAGQPVTAQTRMHLRLIADPAAGGNYAVHVGGVSFTGGDPDEYVHRDADAAHRVAPKYPQEALHARAGGTVYLAVRIGRQGRVLDAAAEQVNLTVLGSARQMADLRRAFAKASVSAAMHWTYAVPTSGPHVGDPYWIARVPVSFTIGRMAARPAAGGEYGRWQPYVRGPREVVPWLQAPRLAADAVDTTPDGSVLTPGQGPQLVTGVAGG